MASHTSSLTQVPVHDEMSVAAPGAEDNSKSAMSQDSKEEAIKNLEDNWDDDERNPRNWSTSKKWSSAAVVRNHTLPLPTRLTHEKVSFYTFVSPLSSSIMAPGLPQIGIRYHITNETMLSMTLSIFLITFSLGALFLAPLSLLNIMNVLSIGFSLGCAFAPNLASLLVFRLLLGLSGSAPVAFGGGVISDLFSERDRTAAMAIYSLGPLIGPVVGPIAGGFITETIGVKYVFVLVGGLQAFGAIAGIPIFRETYSPYIRSKLARQSSDPEKAATANTGLAQERTTFMHSLWINISRPAILLFGSTICFLLSLYIALWVFLFYSGFSLSIFAAYYLMFTVFSKLFTDTYSFNAGTNGLAYIGLGVGFLFASLFSAQWGKDIYVKLSEKNGGIGEPEMRIPPLIIGSFFVPIGLLSLQMVWLVSTSKDPLDYAHHWFWSEYLDLVCEHLGLQKVLLTNCGTDFSSFFSSSLSTQLYLVDTFQFAASALSASSIFRSLFGFIFPLFGQQMYNALGQGGGNSLLAGLSIVLGIPFPLYLWFHGKQMREQSKLTR
ncbi:unnamed protein product [Mycena citricolor]|uniref:Major facilitator superfamily (MFS) profile domain-containing protein n=1 Tax=Mycena citricolor TaxID=2018698 RepID=A0AAD2H519_9AGAR|nr:unnamed protein product [Mycena citricolor]